MECEVEGCTGKSRSQKMCKKHYNRVWNANRKGLPRSQKTCTVPGCGRVHDAKGLCATHYRRWQTTGSLELQRPTSEQRFWARVEKTPDCWLWRGPLDTTGSAEIKVDGKRVRVYRYAYELLVGPIPPGLEVDHICRNRACVNPAHLRAVTHKQNLENRSTSGRGRSGIRGVQATPRGKWAIQVDHEYHGIFDTVEEAALAVRAVRLEVHTHNDADRQKVPA